MPQVSFNIHAAKSNLSRLVMRAEKGERITDVYKRQRLN